MKESTKVVIKTILATSVLGIAFVAGLFIFFPSIKAKLVHLLEQKTMVAGRDTPVIIRGGSIVARSKEYSEWQLTVPILPGGQSGYSTNVKKACRKNQIFVSGQDLTDTTIDESTSPWEIDLSSRDDHGMPRPAPDSGLRICSELNCDLSKRDPKDFNIYMYVLDDNNDRIKDPDVDDDDLPAQKGHHIKKYQRCGQCDYISNVYVLDSTHRTATPQPSPYSFKCNNSDCRVHIGTDDDIKCPRQ
jgi:hypothetical protein